MLKRFESSLRSWLFRDWYAVDRTDSAPVLDLIRRLRPVDCGVELIRVGDAGDGGYLIPNDLDGIEYCFSPGVSTISSFENALADRGIKSFLADYSIEAPNLIRPEITFDKKFLGSSDRNEYFTLETWKDTYLKGYRAELLLQMDIEGAEYEVILNAPDSLLDQFRILVIEFHCLDKMLDQFAFRLISACFEKLLKMSYVVHLHPNNCCGSEKLDSLEIPRIMEFTFLNRRRVKEAKPQLAFPHRLDADNFPRLKHLILPECWHAIREDEG